MIIYALIIIAILFFLSWNLLMSNSTVHAIASLISTVLLIAGMGVAIANFKFHYGMHKVDYTRTYKLAPASSRGALKPIIYQNLGTQKKHNIVIYKRSAAGSKRHTAVSSHVKNRIVSDRKVTKPRLVTTKTRWEYRSNADRDWFGIAKESSTAHTHNTFYVPKKWQVMSVAQVKAIGKIAKQKQAQLQERANSPQAKAQTKQQAQAFVQAQLKKAMQKNPKMSNAQKKALTKRAIKQFKQQMKTKMAAKIMPSIIQQAKRVQK